MITKDYSGNGNDATLDTNLIYQPSATTNRFGESNKAFKYDGVSDYIHHNIDIRPSKSSELTITFWVKHDSNSDQYNYIFGNRKDIYRGRNLLSSEMNNNEHYYYLFNACTTSDLVRIGSTQIQYNVWEFITVVYKVEGSQHRIFLYRNGVDDTNGTITETYCNDAFEYFRTGLSTHSLSSGFEGEIDEFKVFYKALSDEEIRELYSQ